MLPTWGAADAEVAMGPKLVTAIPRVTPRRLTRPAPKGRRRIAAMTIKLTGHVVDVALDDEPETVILGLVLADLGGGESLGHIGGWLYW